MNNNEGLLTLSHGGSFESFDLNSNLWSPMLRTTVMTDNSLVNKIAFIYLKYYNNKNYALNSYVGKGRNRLFIQKFYFKNVNITKINAKEYNKTLIESVLKTSPLSCFEIAQFIECLYANLNGFYTITIFDIFNLQISYNTTIETNIISSEYLFSKCIYVEDYIGAFIYFLNDNKSPTLTFKKLNVN